MTEPGTPIDPAEEEGDDIEDTDAPRTPEEAEKQRAKRVEQDARHPKGAPPGQAGKTHPRDIDTTTGTDGGVVE